MAGTNARYLKVYAALSDDISNDHVWLIEGWPAGAMHREDLKSLESHISNAMPEIYHAIRVVAKVVCQAVCGSH